MFRWSRAAQQTRWRRGSGDQIFKATDFARAAADFYSTPPDLTCGLIDGLAQAPIARDATALLKVIEVTGVAALVTNPPYGRDQPGPNPARVTSWGTLA